MSSAYTSIDTQIEQMIAWGRSDHWIIDHLHCTLDDILRAEARIEAANRHDNASHLRAGEVDAAVVNDIISGRIALRRVNGKPRPPELIEAVRHLAAAGLSDPEIGQRIKRSRDAVQRIRREFDIDAGVPAMNGRHRRTQWIIVEQNEATA